MRPTVIPTWRVWTAALLAASLLLNLAAPVVRAQPVATQPAAAPPKPLVNVDDMGKTIVDEGPGEITTRPAAGLGDALDQADPANLLDRRTEAAIQRGLQYLKQSQEPDGRWAGQDTNWVAYTAFAMIAFMLNGHFPNKKQPYGETMTKALDALLKEAEMGGYGGYMGTNMYSHGLATLALSEAWGQTGKDDKVQEAIKNAVKVILRAQAPTGGWRYNPQPTNADVSVTAMQVVALAGARQAGIFVPDETITKAVRYVQMCHQEESGGFSYTAGKGVPGFARTAAASLSMMMLGRHDSREVKGGVRYLEREGPKSLKGTGHYMYGHYYACLVFYQAGEDKFRWWYPQIRDIMLARQQADGGWGRGNQRTYDSALSLIILSVPYGYVPAYQR